MSSRGKLLYTARTRSTGGRENGTARSLDGLLDIRFSTPGSARIGTNPEQLYAAALSASFESAIADAASKRQITLLFSPTINAEVDLNMDHDVYFIRARLNISLPGVERAIAQVLVNEALEICAYTKATRGNTHVSISLV
jgi:osmotically inducible protein OsmC